MSATATSNVQVSIGANIAGLLSAANEATRAVRAMSDAMKSELGGAAQETGRASAAIRGSIGAISELEERYEALRITNGDKALAARYIALNRNYARERALAADNAQLTLQIMEQYARDEAEILAELGRRRHDAMNPGGGGGGGPGAAPTPAGPTGLFDRVAGGLKDFVSEERTQNRVGGFLARTLSEILPVGSAASQILGQLGGALATATAATIGTVAAFEALKFIAGGITEYFREQRQVTQELADAHAKLESAIRGVKNAYSGGLVDALTPTLPAGVRKSMAERRAIIAEQNEVNRDLKRAREEFEKQFGFFSIVGDVLGVGDADIEAKKKKIRDLEARAAELAAKLSEAGKQARTVGAQTETTEQKTNAQDLYQQRRALEVRFASEEAQITQRKNAELHNLEKTAAQYTASEVAAMRTAIETNAAEEIKRARENREREHARVMSQFSALMSTERQRIEIEGEQQIADARIKLRRAAGAEERRNLEEELKATQAAVQTKLALYDAEQARKVALAQYEAQRAADDREVTAEEAKYLRRADAFQRFQFLQQTNWNVAAADRLAQLDAAERAELETLRATFEMKLVSEEEYERRSEEIRVRYGRQKTATAKPTTVAGRVDMGAANMVAEGTTGALDALMQKHINVAKVVEGTYQSMANAARRAITSVVADWIRGEALKTAATEGGVMKRVALEMAGAVKTIAITAWEALKFITTQAAKAAAGAYSAIASIPFVGPVLAPIAAAAALAAVIGLGAKVASAAGGWEVPSDQLAMVHKDEKILPANKSRKLDQALDAWGEGGGRGTVVHNWNIQTMDASSFRDFLRTTGKPAVLTTLRELADDGRL